jgi:TolB-like protein
MKKMFALIVCMTVCGAAVFAQQLTVAVSPFDVRSGFTNDEAEVIYELFTTDLVSTGKVTVVDRNSFDKVMAEMNFQDTDWSDSDKVARLGKALNAKSIIRGQLMKLGDQMVITVNIIDIKTALILSSARAQFKEINDIFSRMTTLANTVVGKVPDTSAGFDTHKLRMAVSPFDVRSGFSHEDAEVIYEIFTTDLVSTGRVNVVARNSFDKIMAEMEFQNTDWSDSDKVARLSGALNANSIIRGQLMQLGDQLVITVNIIDIKTAQILSSSRTQFKEVNDIFNQMTPLVNTVVGKVPNPYAGFDVRNNTVVKYTGPGGSVTIPAGITAIGEEAFRGNTGLTSVSIPSSVKSIGSYAFYLCTSLTSVSIPDGVTSIGAWAFNGCSSLRSVSIPSSVKSIGANAFQACPRLSSVSISNGVTSIGSYAFNECTDLTSISIPSSITSFGNGVFQGCTRLSSVSISNGVTSIGGGAFWGCTSLRSVSIPSSVTSIESGAFRGCTSLTSIELSRRTKIGMAAFQNVPGSLRYRD